MRLQQVIRKQSQRLYHSINPNLLYCSNCDGFKFYHTKQITPQGVAEFFYQGHEIYDTIPKLSGRVAYDIGACIGSYSLRLAKQFDVVYAFEPNPQTRYLLNLNIRKNHASNIVVRPEAVSESSGIEELQIDTKHPYGTTLSKNHYDWLYFDRKIQIKTIALDDMYSHPDFVKIDVENHELSVLKGMQKIARKYRPSIALEIHRDIQFQMGGCQCEVCSYVRTLGYSTILKGSDSRVHWTMAT